MSGGVCCVSVPVGGWGLCPWVAASCLPLCCASQCDVTQTGHWHGGHQSPSPPGGSSQVLPLSGVGFYLGTPSSESRQDKWVRMLNTLQAEGARQTGLSLLRP